MAVPWYSDLLDHEYHIPPIHGSHPTAERRNINNMKQNAVYMKITVEETYIGEILFAK
jgi:hypothetical protein